jgi:hypothetical protein
MTISDIEKLCKLVFWLISCLYQGDLRQYVIWSSKYVHAVHAVSPYVNLTLVIYCIDVK